MTRNVYGTKGERDLHSVPSKVRLESFPDARYEWVPREYLASSTQLVRPLYDCLGLPVDSLLGVALGTLPLKSIPDDGRSRE